MDMSNTPITVSEIPPNGRQSSGRSFVTALRIGDRTSSGGKVFFFFLNMI